MNNSGYKEGSAFLYSLDAFVKLICLNLIIISVIFSDCYFSFLLCFGMLFLASLFSGLNIKQIFGGVLKLKYFFLFILFMNFAFLAPEEAFYSLGIFTFSLNGLFFGLKTVVRLIFITILGNIFISVTKPFEITSAIETFIYPLKFLGVPVRDVSMILGISMQFIPIFLTEADNIRTAQTARGAPFQGEGLIDKARSFIPLLVPVFLTAFKRADELASAMEARGYVRKKGKLYLKKRHIAFSDIIVLILCVILLIVVVILKKFI